MTPRPGRIATGPIASRDRLPSLTGLRFWAALLVVAYHLTNVVGAVPVISPMVSFGRTGVTFFFVLSGFVLAWTYLDRPVSLRVFAWRRFARLWPLVATTAVLSLLAYRLIGTPVDRWTAFTTFIFAQAWWPGWVRGANGAAWSLSDEAFFYAIFPVVLVVVAARRRRRLVIAACLALIPLVWLAYVEIGPTRFYLDYFPPTRALQFVLGVAAGVAIRRGARAPVGYLPAVAATLAFHALLVPWAKIIDPLSPWGAYSGSQWLATPIFALLIMSAAQHDLDHRPTGVSGRWMLHLGHWSYAWYLIHEVVIRIWTHFVGPASSVGTAVLTWSLLLVVTQGCAAALYLRVERPAEQLLRGVPFRWNQPVAARQIRASSPSG